LITLQFAKMGNEKIFQLPNSLVGKRIKVTKNAEKTRSKLLRVWDVMNAKH